MKTLLAGTLLFHGTDSKDFVEEDDGLQGPAWVSSSKAVAHHFASRPGWGGQKRIITYRLSEDLSLPEILSARDMAEFAEKHAISLYGAEEMKETLENSGLPGWIIPFNYPNGDDILIANTGLLDFVATERL